MGAFLDSIIAEGHSTYRKLKNGDFDQALNLTAIGSIAAVIIAKLTPSPQDRIRMANILLSLILPSIKEHYGQELWTFETAKQAAEAEPDDPIAICMYFYHFDKVDDLGEEEDFYVGQRLDSYGARTGKHHELLSKILDDIKKWFPDGVPILYRRGYLRDLSQRRKFMMADLSIFSEERDLASIFATVLESAGCVFFRTHTVKRHDNLVASEFAYATRPDDMPDPLWSGLKHAFPLRQRLGLNFWRKAELKILQTKPSGLIGIFINVHIQGLLAKAGFERTVRSVSTKRGMMGLYDPGRLAAKLNVVAADCWGLVGPIIEARFSGLFSALSREH